MPKKLEDCVQEVTKQQKEKGKSEKEAKSSAYAICAKATGWVRKKGGGWTKRKEIKESIFDNNLAVAKITQLLEESKSFKKGIYVEAIPDPTVLEKIWKYFKQIGIPVMPINKAHVTVIYSKRGPQKDFKIKDRNLVAKPKAIRIFGRGTKDSPYALVIELDSPDLQKLNKEYTKEYNLHSDFNDYRPHLTITYDIGRVMPGLKKLTPRQKQTIENIFSKIIPELPQRIGFIKQNVEELNPNWR
jgi:hypothetical protein